MPNVLPEYLTEQTEDAIRQRILDRFASSLDKNQGSALYNMAAAMAIEMVMGADWAQEVLRRGFAQTTFGAYLRMRAEEHGVIWKEAQKAIGVVTITGTTGTTIPAGTRVSTGSTQTQAAIVFVTDADTVISAGGSVDVPITAEIAGATGNVTAGAITFFAQPIGGVTVTNTAATSGGTDDETDEALLARYLARVRNPSSGGNKADYVNWALEVAGVGGVSVVPVRDGPGTVSVAIIDTNKTSAEQALIDAVQKYIAPPWENAEEAKSMTLGGSGVSIDETAVQMIYAAAGVGTLHHTALEGILQRPGIWQARLSVKVDNNAGTDNLLQIGLWNVSGNSWAKTTPSGSTDAVQTLQASELSIAYADVVQPYYWNGADRLELRITRLQTDTATVVHVDKALYHSTFSQDSGAGKAPIGATVTVEAAQSVLINVSATLTIVSGYDAASVKAAAEQAIADYLKSLAFADNNDVLYVKIGDAIIGTTGVQDYAGLTVNGGATNIVIGEQQVGVKGTVSLT